MAKDLAGVIRNRPERFYRTLSHSERKSERCSRFCAESAGGKNNQANQQNEAKAPAANCRAAEIKPAAAEQEKQYDDE